jgi:Asp-tRNA(Asn)/Glu-tRNA(Gln) amidotransferase A subunit family amidase
MVPDFLTIVEAGRLIERKELSPIELIESRIDRITRLDGSLNSFICVLAEQALAEARAAEAEITSGHYRGPLHGIPIGLKDLYETAGVATTGHSKVMQDHVPRADAFSVARLRDAGAIVLGKLATHELRLAARHSICHGRRRATHGRPTGLRVAHRAALALRWRQVSCLVAPAVTPGARSGTPPRFAVSRASSRPTAL